MANISFRCYNSSQHSDDSWNYLKGWELICCAGDEWRSNRTMWRMFVQTFQASSFWNVFNHVSMIKQKMKHVSEGGTVEPFQQTRHLFTAPQMFELLCVAQRQLGTWIQLKRRRAGIQPVVLLAVVMATELLSLSHRPASRPPSSHVLLLPGKTTFTHGKWDAATVAECWKRLQEL